MFLPATDSTLVLGSTRDEDQWQCSHQPSVTPSNCRPSLIVPPFLARSAPKQSAVKSQHASETCGQAMTTFGEKMLPCPLAHQLEPALGAAGELVQLVPERSGQRPGAGSSARGQARAVSTPELPVPVVDPLVDHRVQRLSASHTEELLSHLGEQWHALVRTDDLLGPRHARGGVCTQLTISTTLLRYVRPPLRDEALRLAALYAESAAWLYEDAGNLAASRLWTGHAMEWALRPMIVQW